MRRTLAGTGALLGRVVARRDGRAVVLAVALGYPVVYLWALGHLSAGGSGGVDLFVVGDPLSRLFRARSPFSYEPIARVTVGRVVFLLSPLNVLLGTGLGLLVAANAGVALVSWRAPDACGVGARGGPLAGVLGLLSGATCCGPAVFFLLGLQATGTLVSAFGALVPLAVALLVGTLLLAGRASA
jgi:hypothetical protein